jgi:hypothetical protein
MRKAQREQISSAMPTWQTLMECASTSLMGPEAGLAVMVVSDCRLSALDGRHSPGGADDGLRAIETAEHSFRQASFA